jgi:hypothetical protein
MAPSAGQRSRTASRTPAPGGQTTRWLVFVHQLPARPSNLRVRTWRRLQQLGAIALKQSVYVLPDSGDAREDFEWLKADVEGAGGTASVFAAGSLDAWSDDDLREQFRRLSQDAYVALAAEIGRANRALQSCRRRSSSRADFFGAAARDGVTGSLTRLEALVSRGKGPPARQHAEDPSGYTDRLWVTRPRPGVDRMASAWLIRRFIDPDARFGFAADRDRAPRDAVAFDMFGVELTHTGSGCTFETLCSTFGVRDQAVERIAAIVHDLDLKDGRFGAAEAPAIGIVIDGLQRVHDRDDELLSSGMTLFEALYRAFGHSARRGGARTAPRSRAKRRGRRSEGQ